MFQILAVCNIITVTDNPSYIGHRNTDYSASLHSENPDETNQLYLVDLLQLREQL